MPQLVIAVMIGAGVAAGAKWVARELARAADLARSTHAHSTYDEMTRRPEMTPVLKDLGTLEWDAEAGVYRPSRRRA